jgi:hypothetical protein
VLFVLVWFGFAVKIVETTEKLGDDEKGTMSIAFCAPFIDKDVRVKLVASKPTEYDASPPLPSSPLLSCCAALRCVAGPSDGQLKPPLSLSLSAL